ncbi:MAG: hypothetical protein JO041_04200 [Acidobacteria bacterium]|nr:hypothetical protein [Acidobacteriota bacterium]
MNVQRTIGMALLWPALMAAAQDRAPIDPNDSSYHPPVPTVIFDLTFYGANPSHYSVAVSANGSAAYQSNGGEDNAATGQSTGVPEMVVFTMSEAGRNRVFELARKLNYFDGKFDYTKSRIANTGSKMLVFADSTRHVSTTYNYSQNADIQELTRIFQSISATLEYGRRLEHDLRYDKLDLYKQLNDMLKQADAGELAELQAVAPVLQRISGDSTVMHVARVDSDRLLARAGMPLARR